MPDEAKSSQLTLREAAHCLYSKHGRISFYCDADCVVLQFIGNKPRRDNRIPTMFVSHRRSRAGSVDTVRRLVADFILVRDSNFDDWKRFQIVLARYLRAQTFIVDASGIYFES